MKVIELGYPHQFEQDKFPPLSIALGFFDGVHKGHQHVISEAKQEAEQNGWKSAVMTFDPHPLTVLRGKKDIQYITPIEEKKAIFESLGVDYLFIARFTEEFAALSPQDFVDLYLIGLNVKHVTAGFDYSYGRFGKGDMKALPGHSKGCFGVTVIRQVSLDEEKVSSTRIRQSLANGDVEGFLHLTGRHYTTKGEVVHGAKRGRTIGFPTANVALADDRIIPATGVYAVKASVSGETYEGVCNVGYKPTFYDEKAGKPSVEVYLFNFDGEIYGEELTIEWIIRLRSERKFNGADELIQQILKDKEAAQVYFEEKQR